MSVVLPWRKHEYILTAEANLKAAFSQHRERMMIHLAQRLDMDVEEVRAVLTPAPVPKLDVPAPTAPRHRRRGAVFCRHGITLEDLCQFTQEVTNPEPPPPPPPLSAGAPPPSQRLNPMTVAPSRRRTDE